jgi:hypothetical protein
MAFISLTQCLGTQRTGHGTNTKGVIITVLIEANTWK